MSIARRRQPRQRKTVLLALALLIPWAGLAQTQATGSGSPTGQPPTDLASLERELQARPGWTEGWWRLGTAAYDANAYQEASRALGHVVAVAPQMGLAWNLLGLSQFEQRQYDQAGASLERAAALHNSDDPEVERLAAYHLALLRTRAGHCTEAASLLRGTFGVAPNAQASLALGLAELCVPLLPTEVDPAQEALLTRVGGAAARGTDGLADLAGLASANRGVPGMHLALGEALLANGQTREGLSELHRELEESPRSAAAWQALARGEIQAGHAHEAEAARAAAFKAESLPQERSRSWFALRESVGAGAADRGAAMEAFAAGRFKAAASELAPWLAIHPEDGTGWAVLGLSEFQLGNFENARLHLERGGTLGLAAEPRALGDARYTLGLLLLRAGQFDRAATELKAAEALPGTHPRLPEALGDVLLRRAALPSGGVDSLAEAAGSIESMLLESRYDQAFEAFRRLITQHPDTPYLHYAFGTALTALSEFDAAAGEMRAETRISPQSPLPFDGLASLALRQHEPAEAVTSARRAVALAPGLAEPHYLLGRALLDSGAEASSAVHELETAARLNPDSPEIHFSLAHAYARAADPAKAAEERATFARLHALAEAQRGGAPETYSGPRQAGVLSGTATEP